MVKYGSESLASIPKEDGTAARTSEDPVIADWRSPSMARSGLALQLNHYRLTTAHILYHMPDHPGLLQTFVWQDYDLAPKFPTLRRFLDFWSSNLDGKLHSVQIASAQLITPPQWRNAQALLTVR